jgi:hypothetical protein
MLLFALLGKGRFFLQLTALACGLANDNAMLVNSL